MLSKCALDPDDNVKPQREKFVAEELPEGEGVWFSDERMESRSERSTDHLGFRDGCFYQSSCNIRGLGTRALEDSPGGDCRGSPLRGWMGANKFFISCICDIVLMCLVVIPFFEQYCRSPFALMDKLTVLLGDVARTVDELKLIIRELKEVMPNWNDPKKAREEREEALDKSVIELLESQKKRDKEIITLLEVVSKKRKSNIFLGKPKWGGSNTSQI